MNGLFDSKTQLLIFGSCIVGIGIDIDESKEDILAVIVGDKDRDGLQHGHQRKEQHQKILMLHKLEDPGGSSRHIYLVCIS
jgi:hypothetical protein